MRPASGGNIRTALRAARKQPVAMAPVVAPFLVGAKVGDRDLISTIHIRRRCRAPLGRRAARRQRQFAHHRESQECSSRVVPRAMAAQSAMPAVDGQAAASESCSWSGGAPARRRSWHDGNERHARYNHQLSAISNQLG
jgi:hypothetical protein